jgi:glycosyltransferase involved in cell wall biosynthesis
MPGRIKVVRIIARLNIGGPAIHASTLTTQLDPSKYESRLVVGSEGETEGDFLALRGLNLDNLTRLSDLGRELAGRRDMVVLGQLVRLLRRERPHIVHTHTAKAGALGRLAAFLTGVPIIIHTFHGHVLRGYFSEAKTRAFIAIERLLARVTTRLIAVSPAVRSDLLEMKIGRPDRFDVIRLGFDLDPFTQAEQFRGQLRAEIGIGPAVPLVGIVGRLVPIKGHDLFLTAAARIAADTPAHFVIVGDGELRAALEAMVAARGLGGRVHFLGWRADLARIYADLDVVALTSLNEGSPVALIEAMAAARPVVSTNVGGVRDVVADGVAGLLTPSGDAAAFAGALRAVLADEPRRVAMGQAGRASVSPAYTVRRLLSDIDRLYTGALDAAGVAV